jgi:hypothetical protein
MTKIGGILLVFVFVVVSAAPPPDQAYPTLADWPFADRSASIQKLVKKPRKLEFIEQHDIQRFLYELNQFQTIVLIDKVIRYW